MLLLLTVLEREKTKINSRVLSEKAQSKSKSHPNAPEIVIIVLSLIMPSTKDEGGVAYSGTNYWLYVDMFQYLFSGDIIITLSKEF